MVVVQQLPMLLPLLLLQQHFLQRLLLRPLQWAGPLLKEQVHGLVAAAVAAAEPVYVLRSVRSEADQPQLEVVLLAECLLGCWLLRFLVGLLMLGWLRG